MTGKLIKHDLKACASAVGTIYLAAAIAVVALLISAFIKTGTVIKILLSLALIVIAFVCVIVTFVQVIFGANRSLFGREGYLTQTLPVRTSSIIFSKWLTSSFWLFLSYALMIVAFLGVYFYWTVENEEGAQMYDMIYSFAQSMGIGAEVVYQKYLAVSAFVGFFNMIIFVMFVLFAITIANIRPFNKLGRVGIILYLAVTIGLVQACASGLAQICDITLLIAADGGVSMSVSESVINDCYLAGGQTVGFTGVYFKALVTVFIYILTVQLNEHKINLK